MTAHKNLTEALVAFQLELPDVSKGSTNPAFKSKYADLADVTKAVFPVLAKHGLAFLTAPDDTDTGIVLRYELRHTSGESVTGTWPLPEGAKAQELGSWITYGRRYCLSAVTGITPDEDDDGNSAHGTAARRAPRESGRDRVTKAVDAFAKAKDLAELESLWRYAEGQGLAGVAEVKTAYEARKTALAGTTEPARVDEWEAAPIPQ